MSNELHGRRLIVRAGSGQAVAAALPKQRSMELTRTAEMRETATNSGNSQTYRAGRRGWQLTVSGLMSGLADLVQEGEQYTLEISDGTTTLTGQALCSQVKVTGTVGNLAQQSAVFQGSGPLGSGSGNGE